jgi:hypothetical protein
MTAPAGKFDGGVKVPGVSSLLDLSGNPLDIIGAADMQAAIADSEADAAIVYGFASLAYGSLGSTSGSVIGETRTISGGTDDGTRIVWAVPSSGGGATWCYWIWPQEAYAA